MKDLLLILCGPIQKSMFRGSVSAKEVLVTCLEKTLLSNFFTLIIVQEYIEPINFVRRVFNNYLVVDQQQFGQPQITVIDLKIQQVFLSLMRILMRHLIFLKMHQKTREKLKKKMNLGQVYCLKDQPVLVKLLEKEDKDQMEWTISFCEIIIKIIQF